VFNKTYAGQPGPHPCQTLHGTVFFVRGHVVFPSRTSNIFWSQSIEFCVGNILLVFSTYLIGKTGNNISKRWNSQSICHENLNVRLMCYKSQPSEKCSCNIKKFSEFRIRWNLGIPENLEIQL
jgi:hypothetical protein